MTIPINAHDSADIGTVFVAAIARQAWGKLPSALLSLCSFVPSSPAAYALPKIALPQQAISRNGSAMPTSLCFFPHTSRQCTIDCT